MVATIRKALMSDVDALTELVRGLGLFSWMEKKSVISLRDRVAEHLVLCMGDDSHTVLVAEREGVIGYAAVHWIAYLILPAVRDPHAMRVTPEIREDMRAPR